MAYWILKTEPSTYAWDDLVREQRTTWDGVKNAQALIHMRTMRPGDHAIIYHSGKDRAAVAVAKIVSEPYPDPNEVNEKLVILDVEPAYALESPVTLAQIKANPEFSEWALVRQSRLSVIPCSAEQWKWIHETAKQ